MSLHGDLEKSGCHIEHGVFRFDPDRSLDFVHCSRTLQQHRPVPTWGFNTDPLVRAECDQCTIKYTFVSVNNRRSRQLLYRVTPLSSRTIISFTCAPNLQVLWSFLRFYVLLQHSGSNFVSSLVLFCLHQWARTSASLIQKDYLEKKMEAWSDARIKGILGLIIKKIAACWDATRSSPFECCAI